MLTNKWSSTPNTKFFCKIFKGNSTPFMVFNSIGSNIDFLIDRYKGRMKTLKDTSKEEIAKFLILNSANDTPESVYSQMEKTELLNIQTKVEESMKVFNPTSGNVTPAPPKGPTLVSVYKNSQTTPPLFESLTVTIDPKIDGPRQINEVQYDYEIDSDCAGGRGTYINFDTNYISTDKQTLNLTLNNLLTEVGCVNTPTNPVTISETKGGYKFKIRVYTKPFRADGTPDNSRTDSYASFPITFTL